MYTQLHNQQHKRRLRIHWALKYTAGILGGIMTATFIWVVCFSIFCPKAISHTKGTGYCSFLGLGNDPVKSISSQFTPNEMDKAYWETKHRTPALRNQTEIQTFLEHNHQKTQIYHIHNSNELVDDYDKLLTIGEILAMHSPSQLGLAMSTILGCVRERYGNLLSIEQHLLGFKVKIGERAYWLEDIGDSYRTIAHVSKVPDSKYIADSHLIFSTAANALTANAIWQVEEDGIEISSHYSFDQREIAIMMRDGFKGVMSLYDNNFSISSFDRCRLIGIPSPDTGKIESAKLTGSALYETCLNEDERIMSMRRNVLYLVWKVVNCLLDSKNDEHEFNDSVGGFYFMALENIADLSKDVETTFRLLKAHPFISNEAFMDIQVS